MLSMDVGWLDYMPTSAPFRLTRWLPGGGFVLERNPDYAGELPSLREIEYLPLRAVSDDHADSFGNTIFWLSGTPPGLWAEFDLREEFRVEHLASPVFRAIVWNVSAEPLARAGTRRALSAAWDAAAVCEQVYLGEAQGFDFVEGIVLGESSSELAAAELQDVRGMLREDGWEDSDGDGVVDREVEGAPVSLQFELLYTPTDPGLTAALEHYQARLERVGVAVTLTARDFGGYVDLVESGAFDAAVVGFVSGTPIASILQSDGISNFGNFRDRAVDGLMLEYQRQPWGESGSQVLESLRMELNGKVPITPLVRRLEVVAISRAFRGVSVSEQARVGVSLRQAVIGEHRE
jgi:ABC-type transport system substrate-binding protein